jgi:hypothetical protein
VRAVYAGRAGGTEAAPDTTLSFFEAVHHLKVWLGNDASIGITKGDGDVLIGGSLMPQLCADLANGWKHLILTTTRTGDKSTAITRSDVNIFVGTGTAAHRFCVQSCGVDYDVPQIVESAVDEWGKFLTSKGLLQETEHLFEPRSREHKITGPLAGH